jgi:hypothetical protein
MHPADVPRPGTVIGNAPISVAQQSVPSPSVPVPSMPLPVSFVQPQPVTDSSALVGGHVSEQDSRAWSPSVTIAPNRWNTGGAWALSASPLIGALSGVGIFFARSYAPQAWWWTLSIALLPLLWMLAAATRDRARLEIFGWVRRPSRWWLLLGPLAYLIARTVYLRRHSGGGSAPLWWFGITTILLVSLVVAGFLLAAGFVAALHTG